MILVKEPLKLDLWENWTLQDLVNQPVNSPVNRDWSIQACKSLIALPTRGLKKAKEPLAKPNFSEKPGYLEAL